MPNIGFISCYFFPELLTHVNFGWSEMLICFWFCLCIKKISTILPSSFSSMLFPLAVTLLFSSFVFGLCLFSLSYGVMLIGRSVFLSLLWPHLCPLCSPAHPWLHSSSFWLHLCEVTSAHWPQRKTSSPAPVPNDMCWLCSQTQTHTHTHMHLRIP